MLPLTNKNGAFSATPLLEIRDVKLVSVIIFAIDFCSPDGSQTCL